MKVAILMCGAVSLSYGRLRYPDNTTRINEGPYINYHATKIGIQNHIINANPDCTFDFFLHGWNLNLEQNLVELYNPVSYLFEDNELYKNDIIKKVKSCGSSKQRYGQVSWTLSMKRVSELLKAYNQKYDIVIFYRYDILLMKDMILSKCHQNKIYCNNETKHVEWAIQRNIKTRSGDFYFRMNYENALNFGLNLYNSFSKNLKPNDHQFWIPYITEYLNNSFVVDEDIDSEINIAHIRLLKKYNYSDLFLDAYGLTKEEIDSYVIDEN
jgi:hypothetical protein